MFYRKEELSSLNRKHLQKLCKQFGIKANKKVSLKISLPSCCTFGTLHLRCIVLAKPPEESTIKT